MVQRLRSCLETLPPAESGTLVLLAGLGRDEPRTRVQVAHRTGLAFSEVAALQRRALRHLRAAASGGTCGGDVAPATVSGQGPTDLTPAPPLDDALEALNGYPVGLLLALAALALMAALPIYRRAEIRRAAVGVVPIAVGPGSPPAEGLAIAATERTDRAAAIPGSAWVEIRDAAGARLTSVPARIDGGSVRAELPTFPPGTFGTIDLCTDEGGSIYHDSGELEELPSTPVIMVVDMD